tara:strand:+ start:93 stop:410 length:318 start_codon:yes stop_codon:yes gene_type:complete
MTCESCHGDGWVWHETVNLKRSRKHNLDDVAHSHVACGCPLGAGWERRQSGCDQRKEKARNEYIKNHKTDTANAKSVAQLGREYDEGKRDYGNLARGTENFWVTG